jgi:hypothetical protein
LSAQNLSLEELYQWLLENYGPSLFCSILCGVANSMHFQAFVVQQGYETKAFLFIFQPAEMAAMVPYGLGLDLDGIFAAVVACRHLLDELMDLFCWQTSRFNPSHLAAMNAVVALCFIDRHDRVLGFILVICVTQVEQISKVEAVTDRPLMVDHGLYQIVLAFQLLEGEYALGMNHNQHHF